MASKTIFIIINLKIFVCIKSKVKKQSSLEFKTTYKFDHFNWFCSKLRLNKMRGLSRTQPDDGRKVRRKNPLERENDFDCEEQIIKSETHNFTTTTTTTTTRLQWVSIFCFSFNFLVKKTAIYIRSWLSFLLILKNMSCFIYIFNQI